MSSGDCGKLSCKCSIHGVLLLFMAGARPQAQTTTVSAKQQSTHDGTPQTVRMCALITPSRSKSMGRAPTQVAVVTAAAATGHQRQSHFHFGRVSTNAPHTPIPIDNSNRPAAHVKVTERTMAEPRVSKVGNDMPSIS